MLFCALVIHENRQSRDFSTASSLSVYNFSHIKETSYLWKAESKSSAGISIYGHNNYYSKVTTSVSRPGGQRIDAHAHIYIPLHTHAIYLDCSSMPTLSEPFLWLGEMSETSH